MSALEGLQQFINFYQAYDLSKRAGARDKNGIPINLYSDDAVAFCPAAALARLWMPKGTSVLDTTGQAVAEALGEVNPAPSLSLFGDKVATSKDDVIALAQTAIAAR